MASSDSQHATLLHGLALVHRALRRCLETIIRVSAQPIPESDRLDFTEFTGRFTKFLHTHHDGEEEVIFPALRQRVSGRPCLIRLRTSQSGKRTTRNCSFVFGSLKRGALPFEPENLRRPWRRPPWTCGASFFPTWTRKRLPSASQFFRR
ncbi:MAG: hemerythrin domain-containing protein [Myxococcaceae bacterium]|nr:MAG: hemerythrin domain-containing protein [Myxococcaceae bacterium]